MFNSTKFNKNLNNYNLNATIQKNIAIKLVEILKQYSDDFNQILEIIAIIYLSLGNNPNVKSVKK